MPIDRTQYWTLPEFAELQLVTTQTVKKWVQRGRLVHVLDGAEILIDRFGNTDFFKSEHSRWEQRHARSWVPVEIREFKGWHEVLDSLTWLLKVCYAHPDEIKRKHFRADVLFANYITSPKLLSLRSLARDFDPNADSRLRAITDDLKRGWYNELAFNFPPRPSSLRMSFRDMEINKEVSSTRFAFPSWRITQAYYCTYFFLRAVCLQKTDRFRLEEHNATVSTFRSSVQKPLERLIWKFPLSILYEPGSRSIRKDLPVIKARHMHFTYAKHPRNGATPREAFDEVLRTFRRAGRKGKHPSSYGLFDFLRDFRVWGNYQNIDDLLHLYGTGYKAFLDQNLSLVLFFIGGVAELAFMACFSPTRYVDELQSFYNLFASHNEQLIRSPL